MEGAAKSDRVCDGGRLGHPTSGRVAQMLRDVTGQVQPGVKSGAQQMEAPGKPGRPGKVLTVLRPEHCLVHSKPQDGVTS